MKRYRRFIFLGIILLILIFLAGAVWLFYDRGPKLTRLVPPGGSAVHVGLYAPEGAPAWPLNSFIPLTVTAEGSQNLASIQLFVNGELYEERMILPGTTTTSRSETWNWQPGTTGDFILVARAKDVLGSTGVSQPVYFHAVEAGGTTSPVTPQPGQTLSTIAEQAGVSLDVLIEANPALLPEGELPPDQPVYIPNLIPPVTNLKIIPGIEPAKTEEPLKPVTLEEIQSQLATLGAPPQDSGGDAGTPLEIPQIPGGSMPDDAQTPPALGKIWSNLKFQIENLGKQADVLPPIEPVLAGNFSGCDVTLHLQNSAAYIDPSDPAAVARYEDGFYLYRSQDGQTFQRIATWPAVVGLTDIYSDLYEYGYKDTGQYGNVTYMIAAFNSVAEVPSNPVTLPLDPATCTDPSQIDKFGVKLVDGDLVLPFSMDLAYFYIQADTGSGPSQAWRVPEGDRTFLPNSGQKINLYTYLATILDEFQAPDLTLTLEVWGWWGGTLVHAGDYSVTLHRSVLLICDTEGEGACTGNGGGKWTGELVINSSKPLKDQVYDVKWLTTDLSPTEDVCIELAAGPYPNNDYWQMNMGISAGCMYVSANQGTFEMYLGAYLFPEGSKTGGSWGVGSHLMDYDSNWFQYEYDSGEPFTLYMRIYPRHKLSGFNRYANIVVIHYNTAPVPSELPPLASSFDSMYDVEIVRDSYVPPNFETDEKWGCVIVDEDPTGTYAVGQEICPGIVPPKDDCAGMPEALCLLKGMGNAIGFIWDQIAFGYEQYKVYIAQGISMIIPGCDSSDACKSWVKKGVDYGASYATGLPATMPKSEELIGDSVADFIVSGATEAEKYYTGSDISAIEEFCSLADCQKEISQYVQTQLKTARSVSSQPACVASYEAYFHGQQPVCLDPSIIVHPAPGSYNYPGSIVVKVTRKTTPESLAANEADISNYKLDVTVQGTNTYNGDALDAPLYQTARVALPWLKPGTSTYIIVPLNKCTGVSDPGCSGGVNYYGFEGLYFGGQSHMRAVEACYSSGSSVDWVPCISGGSDAWEFTNPSSKTELP